jgi:hypothetical protein
LAAEHRLISMGSGQRPTFVALAKEPVTLAPFADAVKATIMDRSYH